MQQERETLSSPERWTLALLAGAGLIARTVSYFRYRFDSDEPQHLHVAWGWTVGLVQYRDYFDNHAPLFHMATAPLLALVGERADVLLYMRAAMLPLWAAVLACTWSLARRFWSTRVAFGAVTLLSLFPPFFLKSLEYRTDNGWNTLCVLALLVLASAPPDRPAVSPRRAALAGFILGAALCISLKTVLILISLGLAELGMAVAFRERIRLRSAAAIVLAFLGGFVIVPAIVLAVFVRLGAADAMTYCVFTFNELVAKTHPPRHGPLLKLLYPVELALVVAYARSVAGRASGHAARWRIRLGLFLGMFAATLGTFWILISPRDTLPIMPLLAIFMAAGVERWVASGHRRAVTFAMIGAVFAGSLLYYTSWFADGTSEHVTMMNQVLGLTRPGEPLMDYKGETIYRRRPFYFIFELITRLAIAKRLLPDDIPAAVVKAGCHVYQADGQFWPRRYRAFLAANSLDMGRLRAAGQWIGSDGTFSIAVPGDYVIIDTNGEVIGMLDGSPYTGARPMRPGPHRFVTGKAGQLAVLWAPAFQRGYSPFHLRDRDF